MDNLPKEFDLTGRVALVTGGAGLLGVEFCRTLMEAGAHVVVADIDEEAAKSTAASLIDIQPANQVGFSESHERAMGIQTDVSSKDSVRQLVRTTLEEYDRLDILVNNAAIDAPEGNAWDLPDEEWERTIAVNLSGVFYCSRAALVPMLQAGSGCIVNISSQSARHGTKGGSPADNASKAGVLGLTAAFAEQVTERGVRVNAILPALVESRDFGWSPEVREERAREYPLGLGTPKDVGEAVLYLVSPAARWVSGTSLHITGGAQRGSSVL